MEKLPISWPCVAWNIVKDLFALRETTMIQRANEVHKQNSLQPIQIISLYHATGQVYELRYGELSILVIYWQSMTNNPITAKFLGENKVIVNLVEIG